MAHKRKRTRNQAPAEAPEPQSEAAPPDEGAVPEAPSAGGDPEPPHTEDGAAASGTGPIGDPSGLPEGEALTREERLERLERSQARRRRKKIARRIIWALVALLAAAIVAACVAFALLRWETYDDAADFKGQWRMVGTGKVIEVTDDTIVLTDEVAYKYTLDPQAKTILFKFGNMTGSARYRFSLDRQLLSITDGEFDWWGTLCDDVPWTAAAFLMELTGDGAQLSPGSGPFVTELTRDLDPGSDGGAAEAGQAGGAGAPDEGVAPGEGAAEPEGGEGDGSAPDEGAGSAPSSSSAASGSSQRDVDALDIRDLGA